jgi:hypothetical protein
VVKYGKKTFLVLICFIGLIILVSTLHGQGSKKTITLPSGEVVCDLNGEWDVFVENYGDWSGYGTYRDVHKITQQGSSFVGIKMMGSPYMPRDSEAIRGELDKSGFKKVQIISGLGPLDAKGQISEDGNKMIIDDGEKRRQTYTRK